MGIKVAVPAYRRLGDDEMRPERRGKLETFICGGDEVQLGILDDEAELISIKVEDDSEGSSQTKIKAEELLEALNIIIDHQKRTKAR